ncbi:hypothetical protein EJD97_001074 [Solanum chilense]|uniref:Uncharacterized protein n=1 Tax=Solanum chilense TaxID=4083 RepID=A0A6N2AME9_SOLCI|nr:hypothetical protein EJD97_001074 [Solanum chilense]
MRRFLSKKYRKVPPTELVTVRRARDGLHDGPSCWFVMKIREVIPVPKFQEFKCFGTETLDGPLVCDDPSYLPSRVIKRSAEEIAQVWDDGIHDGPS